MRRLVGFALGISAVAALVAGCGGNQEPTQELAASAPATPSASSPGTAVALPAGLDDGPRAGASPIDESKAKAGERLFTGKGCVVCHGFGKRVTCPDLRGVSMRRTAKWMETQILHPEVTVKSDPIAMALRKDYSLPMTNQGLTPDEARAVIEFLKHKDRLAGVIK